MLNILMIDDEKLIRMMVKEYLSNNNISVMEAQDGLQGFQMFEKNKEIIDLVIMDVMMPVMNGIESMKKIREISNVPIIMLTAKTEDEDEITGLKGGAHDYVGKPFNLDILLLKIKKLTNTEKEDNKNFEIISDKKCIIKNGRQIDLTNKEFELLEYLYINKGRVMSRDMILDRIWGMDYFGDYRTVDTHIKKLRHKVDPEQKYIKTYRGVGYKFEW